MAATDRPIRNSREQLDSSFRPSVGERLTLLGRTSAFHEVLTREQRTMLTRHSEELGEEGRAWLDTEWPVGLARFAEHFPAGTPVDDPRWCTRFGGWSQ